MIYRLKCCERFTEMAISNNGDKYDILAGDGYIPDCEYCPFCGAKWENDKLQEIEDDGLIWGKGQWKRE